MSQSPDWFARRMGGRDAVARPHAPEWTRIWTGTAIKPVEIPARFRTLTDDPVSMPKVPDHETRIIGVQATDATSLQLDLAGAAGVGDRLGEPGAF